MIEAILLGIALAMDSLTVCIVNGMKYGNYDNKYELLTSVCFGVFHGLMLVLGYTLLMPFISYIENIDHWIVLIVLSYLGIKMIVDSFKKEEIETTGDKFTMKIMLMEAIATSIDALSSCVLLPSISLNPYLTCVVISIVTTLIFIVGHKIGKFTGSLLKEKAPIAGGIILIALGIKCVIEHMFLI